MGKSFHNRSQDADGLIQGSRLIRISVPGGWLYSVTEWDTTGHGHQQIISTALAFVPTPPDTD
jgi:hypothetical protein